MWIIRMKSQTLWSEPSCDFGYVPSAGLHRQRLYYHCQSEKRESFVINFSGYGFRHGFVSVIEKPSIWNVFLYTFGLTKECEFEAIKHSDARHECQGGGKWRSLSAENSRIFIQPRGNAGTLSKQLRHKIRRAMCGFFRGQPSGATTWRNCTNTTVSTGSSFYL